MNEKHAPKDPDSPKHPQKNSNEDYPALVTKETFTERDRGKLATQIIAVAALIYSVLATVVMTVRPDMVEKVWGVTSHAVISTISLIIGFYFGRKR
jgi:hypothetical protein